MRKVYNDSYVENISYNARKNLNISFSSKFVLEYCETEEQIKKAYDIIAENRKAKDYPLRMTLEQVLETLKIVKHDIFLVHNENEYISSALVFRVNANIAQVIYWGDKHGYGKLKPMNWLSYQLIKYYGELGFVWLDIGVSTDDSIPNYGLCDFKESIGCQRGLKITMEKSFNTRFVEFDINYLDRSWNWLNNTELKSLTMTNAFSKDEQKIWFKGLRANDNYFVWGVEYENNPVGAVGIKNIDKNTGQGEYFGYIGEKEYWSKGIGTKMVRFIINKCRQIGLDKIVLFVDSSNTRAINLYIKTGFKLVNEADSVIKMYLAI